LLKFKIDGNDNGLSFLEFINHMTEHQDEFKEFVGQLEQRPKFGDTTDARFLSIEDVMREK